MSLPPIEEALRPGEDLSEEAAPSEIHGRSPVRIAMDRLRRDKVAVTCFAIVVFFAVVAVFAPLVCLVFGVKHRAPHAIDNLDPTFGYPAFGPPDHGFTWKAPLGIAPQTGYDNLAEWVYGARTSLSVAVLAALGTTLLGLAIGLVAGFSRGWLDRLLSWVIDLFLSLPFLLVALAVAPIILSRFRNNEAELSFWRFVSLVLVLVFFTWMNLARLIRGEVLSLREREFVQAARAIGVPTWRILLKELLPNLIAPIVVSISLGLPAFVSAEAALAYLGVGVVDQSSWGQTILSASDYYDTYALFLWAPLLGVIVLVVALNLLGDAIRDAFDPKTRR